MPDLWSSGGPSLPPPSGPEPDGPGRGEPERTPETPARAPTVDIGATGLSPQVAEPMVFGLAQAYGPEWQQDYGTIAGRTLTGASPAEAFPDATTPERQQYRDALAHILSPGQPGADHPDVRPALSGALADGMPQADRAVVNTSALSAAVERDPETLLGRDLEIPREHLVAWQALAMKSLPRSVSDQMDAMNGPIMDNFQARLRSPHDVRAPSFWGPLDVREASGGLVNMDYYAVRVRLPEGTDPGRLLNNVRTHLDDFVDTGRSSFAPFSDRASAEGNVERWGSTRPTGSFVSINIPAGVVGGVRIRGNDGSVAVIDAARDHWTFATVQSPAEIDGGDGLHPVSGNRQFGYTDNGDGTVTFYTRGVDRITEPLTQGINAVSAAVFRNSGVAFEGADALWRSFQGKIATRVRELGGEPTVERPVIRRPDWEAVDDVLTGHESVRAFYERQSRRR